ncbi:MAG: iron-sulfur cluster assembly accessory protein [Candidatus Eisenbacteria bacterium]|uniref:Iron-sulfur cluster assembly accessory protein n=1 Tax=Eiseniibacteriota bacterium TaxID=2212470 RepID=A0A9D6LBV9_UNCEI|nr:iron-sulfur cluster assembly accessory protein [Candidatus Eisenbacteria bacterium]MBI3540288.1 iron-sulfur cluster assembly accessory protein [Candidatus Eisenbacteria bacterium]
MLTLTEAASRKVAEIMSKQTDPVAGLRVFVQKGGCSGYSYGMSLAPEIGSGDWVGEFGGVKVLVDPESAPVLQGVRIDFVESLQGSGFAIENPNAVRSCGCGNSFETEGTAAEGSLPGEMSV